jgi:prepilin-type N-terminal cleavage/methylation domain-containing protein
MSRRRVSSRSGFTLLEALVALAILLGFAAVLVPFLFQARHIMAGADNRVAAQLLLRALLADPIDRTALANLSRSGETAGLSWRLVSEPTSIGTTFVPPARLANVRTSPPGAPQPQPATARAALSEDAPPRWIAYRIVASVTWARGETISAETVRLGKSARPE